MMEQLLHIDFKIEYEKFICTITAVKRNIILTVNSFMTEVSIKLKPIWLDWFLYDRGICHEKLKFC